MKFFLLFNLLRTRVANNFTQTTQDTAIIFPVTSMRVSVCVCVYAHRCIYMYPYLLARSPFFKMYPSPARERVLLCPQSNTTFNIFLFQIYFVTFKVILKLACEQFNLGEGIHGAQHHDNRGLLSRGWFLVLVHLLPDGPLIDLLLTGPMRVTIE